MTNLPVDINSYKTPVARQLSYFNKGKVCSVTKSLIYHIYICIFQII